MIKFKIVEMLQKFYKMKLKSNKMLISLLKFIVNMM